MIWTGDLPPHDVWNQTRSDNLYVLRETVRQLTFYFPKARIFPALGNHESSPVNRYMSQSSGSAPRNRKPHLPLFYYVITVFKKFISQ